MKIQSHAMTHTGRRANNEDAHCALPQLGLFAVADGMGGYEGGEIASHLAIDTLADFFARHEGDEEITWPFATRKGLSFDENLILAGTRMAHRAIAARRSGRLSQMGSTLAALVVREGVAITGHVGDSRVYRLRQGALEQLTRDHSLYAELQASGMPDLPPRERCPFSHVITRALGLSDDASPDLKRWELLPGDVYLLCTDGLTEVVQKERIAHILHNQPVARACEMLVEEAYEGGGKDNITAVVVRVLP
jgi:serine/threonine protein phosphatase PrpC